MMRILKYLWLILLVLVGVSCDKEIRNIAGKLPEPPQQEVKIVPVDINKDGLDFLEKMQGHWIGKNRIIADDYDWFAFDYRAISQSQIHGIFEGGSMGNLFTSFFVTDFKDTRTLMARNGGLLNGIYRTSYFVLDSLHNSSRGKYYRFVDALGGKRIMSMELRFVRDSLYFNAYTSRLGAATPATRHMTFKAKKHHADLANDVGKSFSFPKNTPAWDFSNGFEIDNLYRNDGDKKAKSSTFMAQAATSDDVYSLSHKAADPYKLEDQPYLSTLSLKLQKTGKILDKPVLVHFSIEALTDNEGKLRWNEPGVFDTVLLFSELDKNINNFLFTYMHPGKYYLNVIADMNEDGSISQGDITSVSRAITITPNSNAEIVITDINSQN
jgi:hypothetical protein